MRLKPNHSCMAVLVCLIVLVACPTIVNAQCYLDQGCAPVDYLNYIPSGTGQVYHGDGASNNGTGGWSTNYSDVNQCLSCHYGTDTMPYLMSGHKNTLRKIAPTVLWGGPDGARYSTADAHYGSGSVFNWATGEVTLGWCTPLTTPMQNGLSAIDPSCEYPYYTLPNAQAPASYTPVAPTVQAGGVRNLFYIYGGWMNYGGTSNPSNTHQNAVLNGGFIGDLYPKGNYDCARCHATGYSFDNWGPEPTQNTTTDSEIADAEFSRIPTDGFVAPGTSGTSSWYLTGIQCERCHVAAYGWGSHPWDNVTVTVPQNEGATALCVECHRAETITPANATSNPPVAGSINPTNALQTVDKGYCSDLSGSTYQNCVTNAANTWIYKPGLEHEAGQAFLNSPHARFAGSLEQNSQNSADLSVTVAGTYSTEFSENLTDPTKNLGCTGCHNPHQSTVAAVNATQPFLTRCDQCHALSQTILSTVNHPAGPGTPFPTGTSADIPGACITCHMQAALGRANSHLMRINANVNYATFPTPDQLYNQDITALNVAPETSLIDATTYAPAAWLDVDLACGQCHVGNDGVTNPYGLTLPPGMPGAHAFTKSQLAYWAAYMHPADPGVPTPTFSPASGMYTTPQNVTISDSMNSATIYYTLDGSLPTTSSAVYTTPIAISSPTNITAIAFHTGYPHSTYAYGQFSIQLPTAPPPLFQPPPSMFSTAQSVKLSNTANLPMYYTLDGSIPTTNSTLYTAPISATKNTTINAITAAPGYLTSAVSTGVYAIQGPAPTFFPASGTYTTTQSVTIADATAGATIYYTTDGSTPTTSSTACANPCNLGIATTTTVRAIASGGGFASSTVSLASYTILASMPTFSPSAGTYYAAQTVTITDTTPGATIYYAVNGFPSTSSPSCASPCTVAVSTTTTLRAIAVANGISQSNTGVAVYTIEAYTPTFSPPSGTYSTAQTVTISDATSGVTLYYTTDGSFPSTSSTSCANPCSLTVSTSTIVKAIAAATGISQSGVGIGNYTITGH